MLAKDRERVRGLAPQGLTPPMTALVLVELLRGEVCTGYFRRWYGPGWRPAISSARKGVESVTGGRATIACRRMPGTGQYWYSLERLR